MQIVDNFGCGKEYYTSWGEYFAIVRVVYGNEVVNMFLFYSQSLNTSM